MDVIEFKKTDLLRGPSIPLGVGRTAVCYLTPTLEVVKLYKHNSLGNSFLNDKDFRFKLERLSSLANDSFICPKGLLLTDGNLVGYTYDYCGAPTMSHLDNDKTLLKLFINYDKFLEDAKKMSDGHLRLRDMHNKNLLFDGHYYMIDVEHSEFRDDLQPEDIFSQNASLMFRSILKHVYGVNPSHTLVFEDKGINLEFNHMDKTNIGDIERFQNLLIHKCNEPNPTLRKLKQKVKAKGVNYGYDGKNEL